MTADKTAAQFYLMDDERGTAKRETAPLAFDQAFERATSLSRTGSHVRVFYSENASQSELSRFANRGIQTSPIGEP